MFKRLTNGASQRNTRVNEAEEVMIKGQVTRVAGRVHPVILAAPARRYGVLARMSFSVFQTGAS